MTGDIVLKPHMTELRLFAAADVDGVGTPGLEFTTRWRVGRRGYLTLQLLYIAMIIGIERRDRRQ